MKNHFIQYKLKDIAHQKTPMKNDIEIINELKLTYICKEKRDEIENETI